MPSLELKDKELIENARSIITKRFKENYHHIGAALRTKSGTVFSAVHLEAYVGRVAICAEAIAIGMAAAAGDTDIETIVAVNSHGRVIANKIATIAVEFGAKELYLQTEALDGGLYRQLGWHLIETVRYKGFHVAVMVRNLGNRLD
jgi:hypothetical protein